MFLISGVVLVYDCLFFKSIKTIFFYSPYHVVLLVDVIYVCLGWDTNV